MTHRATAIAIPAVLLCANMLFAQPGNAHPTPPDHPTADTSLAPQTPGAPPRRLILDSDRARQLLERRLIAIDEERAQLLDAKTRLEAGESVERITERFGDGVLFGNPAQQAAGDAPLTDEQSAMAMKVLEVILPGLIERLGALEESDPPRAEALRARVLHRMTSDDRFREMLDLYEHDHERFQVRAEQFSLDRQAYAAARRYAEAVAGGDGNAAEFARTEVSNLLARQLDLRFEEQRRALAETEQRLQRMRQDVEKQTSQRNALIQERIEALLKRTMERADESRTAPVRKRLPSV